MSILLTVFSFQIVPGFWDSWIGVSGKGTTKSLIGSVGILATGKVGSVGMLVTGEVGGSAQ